MATHELGTPENPIRMQITGNDTSLGKMVLMGALTIAPIAVAIIMQHPALRQAIQMRTWHYIQLSAGRFERAAKKAETIAAHRYDLARL